MLFFLKTLGIHQVPTKKFIFIIFFVFVFSLINLYPSFGLGLFGDSWMMLWKYKTLVQPQNSWVSNLTLFLSSYGSFYFIMGFLSKLVGYQHIYYFLFAYFFRLFAALSFFPLVYVISKNFKAALFASLFFSITPIGLSVTSWVFNMPTYLMIAFFNLFLTFWIKFHKLVSFKSWLLSIIFLSLSYVSSPLRAVAILPFLILLEIYFFTKEKKDNLKLKKLALFLSPLIIYLIFFALGSQSIESIHWWDDYASRESLNTIKQEIEHNKFNFLFYPLITIGRMLVPLNLTSLPTYTSFELIFSIILPSFSIYLILFWIIKKKETNQLKGRVSTLFFLAGTIWTLISIYIYKVDPPNLSTNGNIIFLLLGGYFFIFWILFIYLFRNFSKVLMLLLVAIFLTLTSFSHAWFRTFSIFEPTHRYLILSSAGITLCLSAIVNLYTQIKSRVLLLIPLLILLVNMYSTRIYLNEELNAHNAKIVEKVWSQIPYLPASKDYPLVFYFEGDGSNNRAIFDSISFGFSLHLCLMYKKVEEIENCPYIPITDPSDLVGVVTDGNNLKRYGYKLTPVSLDRVYAYRLENLQLIDITTQVRQKLSEVIPVN